MTDNEYPIPIDTALALKDIIPPYCPYCNSRNPFLPPDDFGMYKCKVCGNIALYTIYGKWVKSGPDKRKKWEAPFLIEGG